MDKREIYESWAPGDLIWSPWVKPVLFAHLPHPDPDFPSNSPAPDIGWLAARPGRFVTVFDLKGADSLRAGWALAQLGRFQAVPLIASCPPDGIGHLAAVPTGEMLGWLERLAPPKSPASGDEPPAPVFCLDANRRGSHLQGGLEGWFDNRSAVFSTDFPSASLIQRQGFSRCLIVRDTRYPAEPDLAYALQPWRKAGIAFECVDASGAPIGFRWPPSHFLAALWHRIRLRSALRPNPIGGFGAFVPESAGG